MKDNSLAIVGIAFLLFANLLGKGLIPIIIGVLALVIIFWGLLSDGEDANPKEIENIKDIEGKE